MLTKDIKRNLGKSLAILTVSALFFLSLAKVPAHASVLDDTFTGLALHSYNSNYYYRSDHNDAVTTSGGVKSGDSQFSEDVYHLSSALTDMSATVYVTNATRIPDVFFRENLSSSGSTWTYSQKQDYGCQIGDDGVLTMFLDNYGSASTLGSVSLTPLSSGTHYLTGKAVGTTLTCAVDGTVDLTETDSTISSGTGGFLTEPDITDSEFIINSL